MTVSGWSKKSGSVMTVSPLGAVAVATGVRFSCFSAHAERIELCLFDSDGRKQVADYSMHCGDDNIHRVEVPSIKPGRRYGFRAHGI